MNRITLSGNLTRDPEVRYTQSGKAYTRVAIAVNRPFGKDNAVDFFNLVAWEKTAEVMGKWLAKGSRILVAGRLQTSKYKDKDGNDRTSVDIIVETFEFAGDSKKKAAAPDPNDPYGGTPVDDSDTPF